MIFVILAAIGFVLALLHLAMQKRPRTSSESPTCCCSTLSHFRLGWADWLASSGTRCVRRPVAASIGWPAGNPFQYEVAVANLAFGVLGLLCLRFRDGFWTATAIGWSVFMLGAAAVHSAPDPHRPAIRSWQCRSHPTFQYRCADLRACASCGSQRSKSDCAQRGCAGRPSGLKPRRSRYPVSRG